jgi:hypothetical protein
MTNGDSALKNNIKTGFKDLAKFVDNPLNMVITLLLAGAILMAYNSIYNAIAQNYTKTSTDCTQISTVKFWVNISLSIVAILGGAAMIIFLSSKKGFKSISLAILIAGIVGLMLTLFVKVPIFTGWGNIIVTLIILVALIGAAVFLELKGLKSGSNAAETEDKSSSPE